MVRFLRKWKDDAMVGMLRKLRYLREGIPSLVGWGNLLLYKVSKEIIERKTRKILEPLCRRRARVLVKILDKRFLIDPCDYGLSTEILAGDGHLREGYAVRKMREILKKDETVRKMRFLDVGANLGYFSVLFGDYFESITCVEPVGRAIETLVLNLKLNDLYHKSMVIQKAVVDEGDFVYMDVDRSLNLSRVTEGGSVKVPAVPLRELLTEDVGLLKMDVEGYEEKLIPALLQGEVLPKYLYLELHISLLGRERAYDLLRKVLDVYEPLFMDLSPALYNRRVMRFYDGATADPIYLEHPSKKRVLAAIRRSISYAPTLILKRR